MRPVEKSVRVDGFGDPMEFNPWGSAKEDLTIELGTFCSYCEKYNSRSALHVEHIHGKNCVNINGDLIYEDLKYRWDNFLLACVNCNSIKDNKDIAELNPFMPHQHNLVHFLESRVGGMIKIKSNVAKSDLVRVRVFVELVGLDRVPGHIHFSDKDDRWDNRLKAFDIAERQLQKYTEAVRSTDIETIVELAKNIGFFTVWYYAFEKHSEVRKALINGIPINGKLICPFPGTHISSFDAENNFEALARI